MGNDNARRLTFGAMMAALFTLLTAITYYVPVLGVLTVFFIPLPVALYSARYSRGPSLTVTGAGVILSFLIAGPGGLILALLNAPVGFIIGDGIRTGKSKLYIFMASGLAVLITGVLQYAAAALLLNMNIIAELTGQMRAMYAQAGEMMDRMGQKPAEYDEMVSAALLQVETLIPSAFIFVSYGTAFVTLAILFPVMRKLGTAVPKFSRFRDMRLPAVLLLYYVIVLVASLIGEFEPGSTGYLIVMNAMLILRTLFFLQGLSLIAYLLHASGKPGWLLLFAVFLAPLLFPIISLLGIIDIGFKLRGFITGSKGK
ncbi:YybS family protein [Bhargavaea ginsengi]|jgi:uncharacterized protein YybS (DUF2232 family)|uniref:YybS family protein n=1 Tax=Bhargavaea ginsengi TaxID=426757 RepID=UPI003C77A8B8